MGGEWDGVVGLGTMGDFAKGGRDAVRGVSPQGQGVCARALRMRVPWVRGVGGGRGEEWAGGQKGG